MKETFQSLFEKFLGERGSQIPSTAVITKGLHYTLSIRKSYTISSLYKILLFQIY